MVTTENESGKTERNKGYWVGWGVTGFVVAFLLLDAVMKLLALPVVIETSVALGWPADMARPLGVILLTCTLLYAVPRTSLLGALLLTGYLGGAVATHLRVGNPLVSHVLFGVYVGLMIWGGLYLRDPRLRALLPFRKHG